MNLYERVLPEIEKFYYGNELKVKALLSGLFSHGHVLIEDRPGVGKTTLIRGLTSILDLAFSRIHFTNDLLPSDIIGVNIYNDDLKDFIFKKGPIFGEVLLADELNRANPKTQSALLQAMEEREIDFEGNKFDLPSPFIVLATQNSIDHVGTHMLPESQLDRFFMGMSLGLPGPEQEKRIILSGRQQLLNNIEKCFSKEEFLNSKETIDKIHVSEGVMDYVMTLIETARTKDESELVSPRAGQDLLLAAKADSYLSGQDCVIPENVKRMATFVLAHRLGGGNGVSKGESLAKEVVEATPIS